MDAVGFISTERTVWCGKCENWHQESVKNKTKFETRIRMCGWKKTKKNGWICQECGGKINVGKH